MTERESKSDMVAVHVMVERSIMERVDRAAKSNRRTRAAQIRQLLDDATREGRGGE